MTDEHPKWDYQEDHQCQRRVIKKLLGHVRVQERILALFVHAISTNSSDSIGRLFKLVRNILAIPDGTEAFRTANGMTMADYGRTELVLRAMKESRLLEFLMVTASSVESCPAFTPHALLIGEIFQFAFGAFSPIAAGRWQAGAVASELQAELEQERPLKKPIRHSNFSGSIVFRLSTGQDYILRQGSKFDGSLDLDRGKRTRRHGGRKPIPVTLTDFGGGKHTWSHQDLEMVHRMAKEFLASCFNVLIRHLLTLHEDLINEDRFHWAVLRLTTWMLQFTRTAGEPYRRIYAILDVDGLIVYARLLPRFHYEKSYPLMLALIILFREVLRTVEAMGGEAAEATERRASLDIQHALFYQMELLQRFRVILQTLKYPTIQAISILVETVHVLLKLLERYCSSRTLFVQKPKHQRVKKSKVASDNDNNDDDDDDDEGEEQAEMEDERVVERRFEFNQFVAEFASEPVLMTYTNLLCLASRSETVNTNANLNRYISVMFYRLYHGAQARHLFYHLHFLDPAHRLLSAPATVQKACKPLVQVCRSIVAGFFTELRTDPLLIVETFFPHAPRPVPASYSHHEKDIRDSAEDYPAGRDEVILPDSLNREQKIRLLVRRLVEQEMVPFLHWLCTFLDSEPTEDRTIPYMLCYLNLSLGVLRAESDSQRRALQAPTFCALLGQLGFRHPSALHKGWHLLQNHDSNQKDAEYVRVLVQEALLEDEQPIQFPPVVRPNIHASSSEDDDSQSYDEESEEASDFDLDDLVEKSDLKQDDDDDSAAPKKESKMMQLLRSGHLTLPTTGTDEDQDGEGDDLPIKIVQEPTTDQSRPKRIRRIFDSDDDE